MLPTAAGAVPPTDEKRGRAGQRRRTRAAIVEAATHLVAAGGQPSIEDIAAAADVSRRTIYLYFPSLDQDPDDFARPGGPRRVRWLLDRQ